MTARSSWAVALMAVAAAGLTGCGSTIAGTSAVGATVSVTDTSSGPSSAVAPSRSVGSAATAAPPATLTATQTVTATAPEPATVTSTPPPVVVPPPVVTVTRAPSTVYAPGGSEADQQVARDQYTAELMVGWWIPQLSSNTDSASAMAKFRGLQGRGYAGIFMVDSADFTSFRRSGYYVILMPRVYTTAADANAWCDAEGFAVDDCLAKQLSHTDGPEGLTVERG